MNIAERLAVSSVTFRDESLEQALRELRAQAFTRLDLVAIRHYCDHFDPLLVSVGEEACQRVRALLDTYDMQAISITGYPANPLAHHLLGDDWVEGVDAYVRLGLILGARTLIFPPGAPNPPAARWHEMAEHAVPWLREAAQRTLNAHMQPAIALQSNSLLRTSQQGMEFLRLLNLPGVGLAVDPAHFAAMGEDPATALRQLGHAIAFVVLRDTDGHHFNLPPGMGRLDYPDILAALREVRYSGPLVLAVDDLALVRPQRVEWLLRGREYLQGLALDRAA